ncbi:AraC family transcriptional regulator [Clostridium thailandense]|uniref:AraC family transcriptional regulator n=1 Tax=Clostridium thailandense TaxID=2794346 RepID=UPI003989A34E
MKKKTIKTDKNQRELGQSLNGNFPLAVNYDKLSDFFHDTFGCHWHPELEFIIVIQGSMEYQVNGTPYILKKDDGIFVNTNALHTARQISQEDCYYRVIRFDPSLIGGTAESSIYEKYINPILSCAGLAYHLLSSEIEWQKKVIDSLLKISILYKEQPVCYELDMLSVLSSMWHLLYENIIKDDSNIGMNSKDVIRMKKALLFIQRFYKDKITLEYIAASCSLSKSELCRLFQRILHQSPIEYTISYRIKQSLALIAMDKYTMTEIAQQVGFAGSSYFTESFRKLIGKTPSQYKKNLTSIH